MESKQIFSFVFLISLFCFNNCAWESAQDEKERNQLFENLKTIARDNIDKKSKPIYFKNLTDFHWEKMYCFRGYWGEESISEKIGFEWNCSVVQDQSIRLVFVNKDSVVRSFDYPYFEYYLEFEDCDSAEFETFLYNSVIAVLKMQYSSYESIFVKDAACLEVSNWIK